MLIISINAPFCGKFCPKFSPFGMFPRAVFRAPPLPMDDANRRNHTAAMPQKVTLMLLNQPFYPVASILEKNSKKPNEINAIGDIEWSEYPLLNHSDGMSTEPHKSGNPCVLVSPGCPLPPA